MKIHRWLLPLFLFTFPCFAISDAKFFEILREKRRVETHTTKTSVAKSDAEKDAQDQKTNGDEERYKDLRGSFNKGLEHYSSGFPDPNAFESLRVALTTGKNEDFNQILIGLGIYKLVSPQASLAFTLAANDAWINVIPPAPSFTSAETAGEMVEDYWTALVRDVPFNEFDSNATVTSAIADLNGLSDFRGPKIGGQVTPQTFLRGNTPGDLIGPYISQFLYLTVPYGNNSLDPLVTVPMASMGNDFITTTADYLTVVNGGDTGESITLDPMQHFLRTPRDLTEYVHQDTPEQAGLSALLIIDGFFNTFGNAVLDPGNPYIGNSTQDGFITFGISQILSLARAAVQAAIKAGWYQKWQVHRRLRPEEYGFYVQQQVVKGVSLGIHPDLLNSAALPEIFMTYGSYFLPQAYPEGSPVHPAYPAGHACLSGAVVTILKAFYNEDFVIPFPVELNAANDTLVPYVGELLTIGNELNKLAANITLGRDHAGVHYRSDGIEGLLLGEKIAIEILENDAFLFNEDFEGYTLTKFDGKKITVGGKHTSP